MSQSVVTPPVGGGNDGVSQAEIDILKPKDGDILPKTEEKVEEKPPEEKLESEVEEEEKLEPLGDDEEITEEDEEKPGRISFSEIKKEFPNLLKKFPQLQANYFKAEKYEEIFPTIEDATISARKAEIFDVFDAQTTNGDFSELISAVGKTNPQGLENVADTILPQLYSTNPQLYVRAIQPVLKSLIGTALKQAEASKNDNLKNAALVLQDMIWGKGGPPADQVRNNRPDPEKIRLEQERNNLLINTATNYEIETKELAHKHLSKLVEDGIDPENKLSPFTRSKLVEQIIADVNDKLAKDPATSKHMLALWKQAAISGFPAEMKPSLIRAFLGRAKTILPAIRQKRKAEAFGSPAEKPELRKTNIPPSSATPRNRQSHITPKEAKKEGLSEMDIIMQGT